jgi:hypothetical protein
MLEAVLFAPIFAAKKGKVMQIPLETSVISKQSTKPIFLCPFFKIRLRKTYRFPCIYLEAQFRKWSNCKGLNNL